MEEHNYKLKYIKYKKKYIELKKIQNNLHNISKKIIILPNEYILLNDINKQKFIIYEKNKFDVPISYIKKDYLKIDSENNQNIIKTGLNTEEYYIMKKKIITPNEYYLLSDTNKSKYVINESDYDKFPNRVVPKNYIKII